MQEITLVSFNTHCGVRARRNGMCEPYDLAHVLEAIDADVLVLQESFTPDSGVAAARLVADALGGELFELPFGRAKVVPWPHVPRDQSGSGTVGLAVLSRLPARERGRLGVGRVAFDPTPERGGLHVEIDVDGTPIDIVGVHLSSRLPYGPPIQLRRLRSQLPANGNASIVAGDCNFWGPGVSTFLPGWKRAVRGRTWPASRPHSQIDHILVSPRVEVLRAEVLPDVGSDHRPVRAQLRVR